MAIQEYFDLHFHPVFKQYLTRYEDGESQRTAAELEEDIFLTNDLLRFLDRDFLHLLGSQTSLSQMRKGRLHLGIANFVAIEYGIANSTGILGDILRSKLTRPLDKQHFRMVQQGKVSYFRLFLNELALYEILSRETDTGAAPVILLSRHADAGTAQINKTGIRLALALEGGHNLCRDLVGRPGQPDSASLINYSLPSVKADFENQKAENPRKLGAPALSLARLMDALWADKQDLFYLTLTHLTHIPQQLLATHAYGMKLLRHVSFYPQGSGLTAAGKEVVHTAYTLAHGEKHMPLLIDVKHMSLQSRLEFYEYRRAMEEEGLQIPPILATHMGVTGYSISGWRQARMNSASMLKNEEEGVVSVIQLVTERKIAGYWGSIVNNQFTFNPWSINLMDEDIYEILKSGGLIGISLDARILGFQQKVGLADRMPPEYLSPPEYRKLFGSGSLHGQPIADPVGEETESWLVPAKHERQPIAFCFNIVHILTVAAEYGLPNAAKQICVGSDFDGLIDPLATTANSGELGELKRALTRWLPVALRAYAEENGTKNVLEGYTDEMTERLLHDILFGNGKSFLERWLNHTL